MILGGEVMSQTASACAQSKNEAVALAKRPRSQAAFRLCPAALAISCLSVAAPGVAQITTSGAVNTFPGVFPVGPGNTDIGNNGLFVGNGATGSLDVTAGSVLRVGSLFAGSSSTGNGVITVNGVGTRLELTSDGFSNGVLNRLGVGEWGVGRLTVSGGASLNGTVNGSACLGAGHFCNNFIGNAAGSDGTFTVTGAGSQASFLRGFFVGGVAVFRPPIDSFTLGTPGGITRGRVEVLDGGTLNTERANIGQGPNNPSATGNERSFAEVLISGPNSVWNVRAGSLEANEASMYLSNHANSWVTFRIDNGGKLQFEAPPDFFNGLRLNQNGGRTDMVVTGSGSAIDFNGGLLHMGRRLGTANLEVSDGARLNGLYHMSIGRDASVGNMTVDGPGSVVTLDRNGNAGTADAGIAPGFYVGRNGTGILTVRNGGRVDVVSPASSTPNSPHLILGDDAGNGTLNIMGAGSVVSMTSQSILPGGGPGEARNPVASIGRESSGTLNVTEGGKLILQGNAVSTVADSRSTAVNIGGINDTTGGGHGIALVDGPGSEMRVEGSDAFIGVGRGPGSTGQLTISNQALVSSRALAIGRGGVGVLKMDNARVELSGQQTGGTLSGANLSIGSDGGVGSATLMNGSRVVITNLGSAGASLNIGGTSNNPLGDGTLTLRGGSEIQVIAGQGTATMNVGRDGSGLARIREGSSIDLGDGNLYVGRLPGSDGTMVVTDSSTINASWVGVGRNKNGNGGTGTLVVTSGSTLEADTIEIGPNGFLGGNGTIVGNITNFGIVAPGTSPGTMTIDGSFVNAAGGRIFLEIESNGAGGFNTDQLIFAEGSTIDLAGVEIQFQFLGETNPNQFQASGLFDIDTFMKRETPGGNAPLDDSAFADVDFTAQADAFQLQNFKFDVGSGASFVAVPVPEPSQWAMMVAGAILVAGVARRRRQLAFLSAA
jgi:T5SS/PEP-CTERM-associated repeat protein